MFPKARGVDSPIDHALESRQGVCQDFAHIMIALTRRIGIPCRYVSGYLFHKAGDKTRSAEGATHAWVETLLPGLGWVGLDPTNNVLAGERHVRTSVGRDYADVPPTKGVFKGSADSQLLVAVHVAPSDAPPLEPELGIEDWSQALREEGLDSELAAHHSNNNSSSSNNRERRVTWFRWRARRRGSGFQRLLDLWLFHGDVNRLFQEDRLLARGLHQQLQSAGFDEGRNAELDGVLGLIQHLHFHVEGMVGQIDLVHFGFPEKDALNPQNRSDLAAIGLHLIHHRHLS